MSLRAEESCSTYKVLCFGRNVMAFLLMISQRCSGGRGRGLGSRGWGQMREGERTRDYIGSVCAYCDGDKVEHTK